MTRSDYEKIAACFKEYKEFADNFSTSPWRQVAHIEMVTRISKMLKSDNPRFDFDKFFKACGLGD